MGSNRTPDKYSVDPFCPLTNVYRERVRHCAVSVRVCARVNACVGVCVRMSVRLHVFVIVR